METEDFLRVINELDFIRDDIEDIGGRLDLTKSECNQISRAITALEKSRKILAELFPNIKSLGSDVREDLATELVELEGREIFLNKYPTSHFFEFLDYIEELSDIYSDPQERAEEYIREGDKFDIS